MTSLEYKKWVGVVKVHLDQMNLKYELTASTQVFQMEFVGSSFTYRVLVLCGEVEDGDGFATVVVFHPKVVHEAKRVEILEFLNSRNRGVAIGGFELHGSPGRVVFKSGRFLAETLTLKEFSQLLLGAVGNMNSLSPELEKVLPG